MTACGLPLSLLSCQEGVPVSSSTFPSHQCRRQVLCKAPPQPPSYTAFLGISVRCPNCHSSLDIPILYFQFWPLVRVSSTWLWLHPKWILSLDYPAVISDFTSKAPQFGPFWPPSPPLWFLYSPPCTEEPAHHSSIGASALTLASSRPQYSPCVFLYRPLLSASQEMSFFPAASEISLGRTVHFPRWCFVHVVHAFPACGLVGTIYVSVFKLQTVVGPLRGLTQIMRINQPAQCLTPPCAVASYGRELGHCVFFLSPHACPVLEANMPDSCLQTPHRTCYSILCI